MNEKVFIVTGASAGIGEVAARELARDGTVVMVCRNREKGERVRDAVVRTTGNERVELIIADLGVQADVRRAAEQFKARHDRLDVLVNNAGAVNMKRTTTVDGLETTFAVNHLGYFLLTHLLLDVLEKSAPSRIINVSSRAHFRAVLDLDDLQSERDYRGFEVYCQSKLANVLFTYELARRLEGTGVTVNCLHPGVIASGFGRNNLLFGLLVRLGAPFMKSPEEGARTMLHLARSPELERVTGQYFDDDTRQRRSSRVSYDRDLALGLWERSAQLAGIA